MPSNFVISTSFGDDAGASYRGTTSKTNSNGVTSIQFSGNNVAANATVNPSLEPNNTTCDVTIYTDGIVAANVIGLGFVASVLNLNGNTGTPLVYVKLKGAAGSSHDIIIPLTPGSISTWSPGGSVPVLGAGNVLMSGVSLTANLTSITVTPDPTSDILIQGTIDVIS